MKNTRKSKDKLIRDLEAAQREIEIEKALGRVRSRSLAMEDTNELNEISQAIYNELIDLDIVAESLTVVIHEQERDLARFWTTSRGNSSEYDMPLSVMTENPIVAEVRGARERDDDSHRSVLDRQGIADLAEWANRLSTQPVRWVAELPGEGVEWNMVHVFFDVGNLHVILVRDMDDNEVAILKRFADAFAHAYHRHLELDQKIRQNRELTIQNAIERVRARALGMQESSELDEVSAALFEAVGEVGIERNTTQLAIGNEEADEWQNFIQMKGVEGLVGCVRKLSEIEAGGKVLGGNFLKAWRQGASHYFEEFRDEEWQIHTNYWSEAIRETNPDYERPDGYPEADHRFILYAYNRFGGLGFSRPAPPYPGG